MGFEAASKGVSRLPRLDYDISDVEDICALDLVREAFHELSNREDLRLSFERVSQVMQRLGY